MAMARSAASRFATGAANVTTTGCATPTTWPAVGSTDAIAKPSDWFAAARLEPAGTATTLATATITVRTHRTTACISSAQLAPAADGPGFTGWPGMGAPAGGGLTGSPLPA